MAQTFKVAGVVTSAEDDAPVIGASVLVKGTTMGTITGINGEFEISGVPTSAKVLIVSYMGLKTQEVTIEPRRMKIVLQLDSKALDEVVVTAMGISREKKALGYAMTEVGGDEMIKARGE